MFVEFMIQNQFFSYSLEEFAQILDIPCEGACVFTDKWSLDELAYGVPTDGPYQTNPPSPDDIIRNDRECQVRRIHHEEEIDVQDHQVLTREIVSTLKPLEEIIWENVFSLGCNQDLVPACLCYMLYCVANSEKFNLTYYMAKLMEWVTKQARPSNPQPLKSHPSLDIILSLSPITPLDHILNTPSPPSLQPPPQPPPMGHPIYFNYYDYHGSTCLCCFHNRNLIFSVRDEMNLIFAHIEYLLTSTMNSLSPPHP
ncbi:hypothetical protein Tco_0796699 [Tanacetum coccineum]